jgi:hypothetical protein
MYLGSAAAMLALPQLGGVLGPAALLRLVGCLGLGWLALWRLTLARLRPGAAAAAMPLHDGGGGAPAAARGAAGGRGRATGGGKGRGGGATPWRAMLAHPAVWAIVVNNFTFHYAFYVVMNWLPTYFDKAREEGTAAGCLGCPVCFFGCLRTPLLAVNLPCLCMPCLVTHSRHFPLTACCQPPTKRLLLAGAAGAAR